MNPRVEIIFVLGDNTRAREVPGELPESLGWPALILATAAVYLAYRKPELPACQTLDIELPDISTEPFSDADLMAAIRAAASLAHLVRTAGELQIPVTHSRRSGSS